MTINAPQIAFITLMTLSLGFALAKHGERKSGNWNVWWNLVGAGVQVAILYWGGFFG